MQDLATRVKKVKKIFPPKSLFIYFGTHDIFFYKFCVYLCNLYIFLLGVFIEIMVYLSVEILLQQNDTGTFLLDGWMITHSKVFFIKYNC